MEVLGMKSLSDASTANGFPEGLQSESKANQKLYLRKVASLVIDKYVIQNEQLDTFLAKVLSMEEHQVDIAQDQNADGRFVCRFPGCDKLFAYNGTRLKDHEAQHNPPVQEPAITVTSEVQNREISKTPERDNMYSYQCSFLRFAMIIINFFDALREGDGKRIVQCWKFALPYL